MQPGEWEARFGMVKTLLIDLRALPVLGGVALRAIGAKTALVLVFMAGGALRIQAQESVVQIFPLQHCARRHRNMLRGVACAATDTGVFAVERIAGSGVVKARRGRFPMQQGEIFAVMV